MSEQLVSTKDAARILCVSEAFLERDRWAGARIPFVKIGRAVRYCQSDLDAYVAVRRRRSTSQVEDERYPRPAAPGDEAVRRARGAGGRDSVGVGNAGSPSTVR
jgi:hypothetical protein